MAYTPKPKAEKEPTKNIADPVERKNFKIGLSTITGYMQIQDDQKEAIKETVDYLAKKYGLKNKTVRRMANTMFKHNYADVQEENHHFEEMYETIVEGSGTQVNDPLDDEDDNEDDGE